MNLSGMLWAPHAWVGGRWASAVLLRVDAEGRWCEITPDTAAPPEATVLRGPALPGLVNAHSHAFQRAFAGLAERRELAQDDFWSWRERMYAVALRITPEQLRDVAAMLYLELMRGGYTQVCEFHYLQRAPDGSPYADPMTLAWALADAAADAGCGLTLMPALYERAGFSQPALRPHQRRFASDAHQTWQAVREIAAARRPLIDAGLVAHSLRAASPASLRTLRQLAEGFDGPIHIHVAEQTAEVDDCLAATGQRPIAWLAQEGLLDARWQLVHATHVAPAEIDAVAASGAGVVLCPSTEANLGDGFAALPGWLAADVPIALGTDSHITRDWREELRWLEYGQRLLTRQRVVSAAPERAVPSSAERLWSAVLAGGATAAGQRVWGLVPGARADLLVADARDPVLRGMPASRLLDAMVFSSPARPWADVMVAGRWLIRDQRHAHQDRIEARFEQAMHELWADEGSGSA